MIRVMNMIRGMIKSTTASAGKIMRASISGRTSETIDDREMLQQYGISSRPKTDAEVILLRDGNQYLIIASDDRRYRISLAEGEVALYTDEGDVIHLKRGKEIDIKSGSKINIESGGDVSIDANSDVNINASANVDINATASVKVKAPSVKMGQGVIIDTAMGVVTQLCVCSITGAPHPQGSLSVKATN